MTLTPPQPTETDNGDDPLYEIIDGNRVDLPPMSILSNRVTSKLHHRIASWAESHGLGEAVMECLLRLPVPLDRNRRPDIAFISAQHLAQAPQQPGSDNAWQATADLYVEVISPTDMVGELQDRLTEYFQAWARAVWVVFCPHRLVYVYSSLTDVRVLRDSEELDGGTILPGFRVPISSLFPT
jgi:Uma2 family endonuclease